MDDATSLEFSVPESIHGQLFNISGFSDFEKALEHLTGIARTVDGRLELATKNTMTPLLQLCQILPYPSKRCLLHWSLKLLRNLCAGEIRNQSEFIVQNGVQIVSNVLKSVRLESDYETIRFGLQVLGNISLEGEKHGSAVWHQLFPNGFLNIARLLSIKTCDPLCMIIYSCCKGSEEIFFELCSDQGLHIIAEIISTASKVGFQEDWLLLLLSRICLEESHFTLLFSKLCSISDSGVVDNGIMSKDHCFVTEQNFLLHVLSEILSVGTIDIGISIDFAESVLRIFKSAVSVVDFASRGKSRLPTGSPAIDVLGYSLVILRDICAADSSGDLKVQGSVGIVDSLISSGLLELLLNMLHELEPPSMIRKALEQSDKHARTHKLPSDNSEETTSSQKLCPYRGFRRDLVAVIGNCAYRRKNIQDKIRENNAILCLLQQCVTDEENPFLREWGIWSIRNILEGNLDNQLVVSELKIQGSVDVPEISGLGLRVEVDEKTGRAKLVNS